MIPTQQSATLHVNYKLIWPPPTSLRHPLASPVGHRNQSTLGQSVDPHSRTSAHRLNSTRPTASSASSPSPTSAVVVTASFWGKLGVLEKTLVVRKLSKPSRSVQANTYASSAAQPVKGLISAKPCGCNDDAEMRIICTTKELINYFRQAIIGGALLAHQTALWVC